MPCPMTICQMAQNLLERGHGHDDTTSLSFLLYAESKLNDTFEPKVVLKMLFFLQMEEESNNCIRACDAIYSSNYGIYLIVT